MLYFFKKFYSYLFIFITILTLCICGRIENYYNRKAVVIKVDQELVTVKDLSGYIWEFEGSDYREGDNLILRMFNNYTVSDITDDIILDAYYN